MIISPSTQGRAGQGPARLAEEPGAQRPSLLLLYPRRRGARLPCPPASARGHGRDGREGLWRLWGPRAYCREGLGDTRPGEVLGVRALDLLRCKSTVPDAEAGTAFSASPGCSHGNRPSWAEPPLREQGRRARTPGVGAERGRGKDTGVCPALDEALLGGPPRWPPPPELGQPGLGCGAVVPLASDRRPLPGRRLHRALMPV